MATLGPTKSRVLTLCLLGSALLLAMAPIAMPASYSWIANTTSESAAQGLKGAWIARLGFVLFGASVIALAPSRRSRWGVWATALHIAFGVLMIAAAVFSNRPIEPGVPVDDLEDSLHSVAATLMGFAFAGGVALVAWRSRRQSRFRALDVVAVVASAVIPLGMTVWPDAAGVMQRGMFLIAYLWYLGEAQGSPIGAGSRV